jgi:hypothetical protein
MSTSVRVHVAGGLVEDENAGVGDEGAGDGQELPLAGRDVRCLLVEDRVVAVREGADEPVDVRRGGRGDDLLLGRPLPSPASTSRIPAVER